MILDSLLVRQFRMIEECAFSLSEGMQLFLGMNAQGKTSLIEAILFLSTSTSHRTRKEEELIRWGSDVAFLRGETSQAGETCRIECGLEKKRKLIKIDGVAIPRVKDLYGYLRTVLFAPEDLSIVDGSPQERRRFLDIAMAQLEPSYIGTLLQYRKILDQRNHLLRQIHDSHHTALLKQLDIWDRPFIETAAEIISKRARIVSRLHPLLDVSYSALADDGPLRVVYSGGVEQDVHVIQDRLSEKLQRLRANEIDRSSTQTGPHRDDITFILAEKNLSLFGSQGQRRASVLALRLAQAKLFFEFGFGSPLLLIDDVVYEMDNTRRERFWKYLDFCNQMIVTATDREHLGPGIQPQQIFKVDHGKVCLY